ncbi:MAG: WecB/TagA/CpsF family glycosyltransferase [Ruminiclostridium sp.]|nr:WecB/TagA/CpsF family glycosyltransferase [Ruminiclostridium sp.]
MRKTIDILGIQVDSIEMQEAMEVINNWLTEKKTHTLYTPNAEILMAAQRDPELKEILNNADMLVADGAGVVLASKILQRPVPEKVSGIDLVKKSFTRLSKGRNPYFLLGSKPGVAEAAAVNIINEYPGVIIAGCRNGYFTESEEDEIIEQINASGAAILLVALGAPRQEKWIARNKDRLKVKICAGVGGTLDVFAGTAALAPEFMRRSGFEWLFRLYKEPRRAKRMLDLPRFMARVISARLHGG